MKDAVTKLKRAQGTRITMPQLNSLYYKVYGDDFGLSHDVASIWDQKEPTSWCIAADKQRARLLRAFRPGDGENLLWVSTKQLVHGLENGISQNDPREFPASALYMRQQRAAVLSPLLDVIRTEPGMTIKFIRFSVYRGLGEYGHHWHHSASQLVKHARSYWGRAGVLRAPGFVVAFLVGCFNPERLAFEMELRAVVGGDKAEILSSLNSSVTSPDEVERLTTWPEKLCWVMPLRILETESSVAGTASVDPVQKKRARELYHRFHLLWLAQNSFDEMLLISGLRVKDRRFVLTNV